MAEAVQEARTLSNKLMQTYGQSGTFSGLTDASVSQLATQGVAVKSGQSFNAFGGQIESLSTSDNTGCTGGDNNS